MTFRARTIRSLGTCAGGIPIRGELGYRISDFGSMSDWRNQSHTRSLSTTLDWTQSILTHLTGLDPASRELIDTICPSLSLSLSFYLVATYRPRSSLVPNVASNRKTHKLQTSSKLRHSILCPTLHHYARNRTASCVNEYLLSHPDNRPTPCCCHLIPQPSSRPPTATPYRNPHRLIVASSCHLAHVLYYRFPLCSTILISSSKSCTNGSPESIISPVPFTIKL
ncbi:hypothetical protein JAAARDRAFT_482465 [Jaapia argillacea MUCL 33604]|uniref:Uncharacterized protein n=1 Tax=Jaapia argillacea MUCL 33604 TaxID=933084 RepID=A0A067PCA4_9AGAM|nr:hypothetical protein JAAARDRAFT_482465 [Jaapia argillacea MUCL 33604]